MSIKSSKITIKDPVTGSKLTIKTSTWKTKLKLKGVPTAAIDLADGLEIRMTLQGCEGDLTTHLRAGSSKKLAPVVGTMTPP